jgi:hypothetical protein
VEEKEGTVKEFKDRFRVGRIVYVRMGLEGSTEVEGELLGLLLIKSVPECRNFFPEKNQSLSGGPQVSVLGLD